MTATVNGDVWCLVYENARTVVSAARPQSRRVVRQSMSTRRETSSGCRHRRHGVTATPTGNVPTGMSVGSLVLVFTSIVDTVSLP